MAEMAAALAQLLELQKKDTALDMLGAQLKAVPETEAELSEELETAKTELNAHREQQKKLALKHKELERELKECEQQTRKHQAELNQVKSNDAFKALLSEIEECKKRTGELESEIISALEALDAAAAQEKRLAAEFAAVESSAEAKLASLATEKNGLLAAHKAASEDRAAFSAGVDAELLSRYEHIRKQRAGLAVCAIKEHDGMGACSGCNMALRPQALVSARKKSALTQCDNCQRILFVPEAK
ncbi:MAG TPA: C4-type zinc ribbon domain-containing protein [Elusimicrobiales bacterium]|nr:C4-type zinc ribbon domain-containing protein [Elusimicrobiales bacterium]